MVGATIREIPDRAIKVLSALPYCFLFILAFMYNAIPRIREMIIAALDVIDKKALAMNRIIGTMIFFIFNISVLKCITIELRATRVSDC